MDDTTLVGIDLGKHSLHGQDRKGNAVFRRKLSRKQLIEFFATFHVCTVAMEACAGSHRVVRKLAALRHTVKLISPQFVLPFVKSNKSDFVGAQAICEAASRPTMSFVTLKTESRQALSVLHCVRQLMMRSARGLSTTSRLPTQFRCQRAGGYERRHASAGRAHRA